MQQNKLQPFEEFAQLEKDIMNDLDSLHYE